MIPKFNSFDIMTSNGWKYVKDDPHSGVQYDLTIVVEFDFVIRAYVSDSWKNIDIQGHLGIVSLEVAESQCEFPLMRCEIDWMLEALNKAEKNLLSIGMPFEPNTEFHGKNAANMKRRNDALRRKYQFADMEKSMWEYRNEKIYKEYEKLGL